MAACAVVNTDALSERLREIFLLNRQGSTRVTIQRWQSLYTAGDADCSIYYIESGSIKMHSQSAAGRECLLGIQVAGEIFGELALVRSGKRLETATARERGVVWRMRAEDFVDVLRKHALLEDLMLYLAGRLAEQQKYVTRLLTETSQQRLGQALLDLSRRLGTRAGDNFQIKLRISHDELSAMVGTTRPRVSTFISDFKRLGLISVTPARLLVINEMRLRRYLEGFHERGRMPSGTLAAHKTRKN